MSSVAAAPAIDEFRAVVRELGCSTHSQDGEPSFEIDGLRPSCVVEPQSEDALARTLAEARIRGVTVIPVGGGRHLHIGNVPSGYDVALSTRRLTTTLEHEPDDLTATVDAGVRVGDLAATLAARGQWLPIDAPGDSTVGGIVAANTSGPLRHAHGTLRDWVIGMRIAHSDGSVSKAGGRVVKNVAGYDMHKLHVGALGTLGVITQVTFKLATMPRACAALRASFEQVRSACAFVLAARDRGLPLIVAEVLSPAEANSSRWTAVVRTAGQHVAVERSVRELTALAETHGAKSTSRSEESMQEPTFAAISHQSVELRAGVQPTQVAETIEDFRAAAGGLVLTATVCAGVVRCTADLQGQGARDFIARATRAAERQRGSLFIETAPEDVKREMDVFGPQRADWEIMMRLKREFDPTGTLSRGRFAGRI